MMSVVRCARCNIPLSDPRSVRRGYGPICWGRIHGIEDDGMAEGFERVSAVIENVCPICGKPLFIGDNLRYIKFRVLLAEHLLKDHPSLWQGSLDRSLDVRRKEKLQYMYNCSLDDWREEVESWPPPKLAAFYQLMEPVYAQTINMERTSDVVLLNDQIWEVQNRVAGGGDVEEYYRKFLHGRGEKAADVD